MNTFNDLFEQTIILPNGCWEFTGYIHPDGYGRFRYEGKQWATHQLSFVLCVDDIPTGLLVCHECDYKPCINPEHLFLGTHKDNSIDMFAKGRVQRDGSNNGRALFTESEVRTIKTLLRNGATCAELAAAHNVSWGTIKCIKANKTWRHV